MLVNFNDLSDDARIWIYQSNREFSLEELKEIESKMTEFVNNWQRHGEDLKAAFTIKYNQFVVIAVDESFNQVSGCSIDASVNLMKQFEEQFSLDLTDKMNITFKDGNSINVTNLSDFKKYAEHNKINASTIVFNNMVATKRDFLNSWEVTADKSWHKRFLVQ